MSVYTDKDDTVDAPGQSPVQEALDRFKLVAEAEKKQRDREIEDLKFVDDPDGQWPEDIRRQRKGQTVNDIVVPGRPCLTFDGVSPAIDQVSNQARNARLAVNIKPKGSKAQAKTAEMLKGLYREIEISSRAHQARMWALERAAKCGRGYYRILKTYSNDGDFDLDLVIARILNQHSVYLDPFHQEPDGSDADWAFIVEDLSWAKYKRDHAKKANGEASELASYDDEQLSSLGDAAPGWMNGDGAARTVRVAEYFCRKWTKKKLSLVIDKAGQISAAIDGEFPDGARLLPKAAGGRSRMVDVPSIHWQLINGVEVLDEQEWEGRYIPIVQVLGKETNINGERGYRGIVAKAKDSQRAYNTTRSREMELLGLASSAPWLIMEGLIEGYEKMWQAAATLNLPYLLYRAKNLGGEYAPPPKRNVEEPPIQAVVLASQQAREDIKSTTKTFDPSLGKSESRTQSGRAIQALQQQAEHGNSNYLEDLAQVSMFHEARIVVGMLPFVYDRPGRIAQIRGLNDEPKPVMLNQPFVKGPDGQPMEAPPDAADAEHYELTPDAEYSVTVTVGKAFTTQREETSAMIAEAMGASQQLAPALVPLLFKYSDFPGAEEAYDVTKKLFWPPELQNGEDGKPAGDPQAQAQIQQLQLQLQQALGALQEAKSGIAKTQIKAESDERIAGAKMDHERELAALKADVERLKISIQAATKGEEINAENARVAAELAHEERTQARDHAVQEIQARRADAHAAIDRQESRTAHAVDLTHAERMSDTEHLHAKDLQASAPAPKKPRAPR